jgi:glycerophosphoryl diester phosphodiesterase
MTTSFLRVAHRGGARLAPENTLAAFRNALTLPVDAIEMDVHMSRDGFPVVIHDNTVERLTNGEGNILDLDLASLRSLNAAAHFPGGWPVAEQIPTLREVLDLAQRRVQVLIEIKTSRRDGVEGRYPNIAEAVVNELRATSMLELAIIISFDWQVLPIVKSLEPTLATGALVSDRLWNPHAESALDTLIEQIKPLGCEWISLDHKLFTPDMLASFHKQGLRLGLWTVNALEQLQYFAAVGVDSLTTDRPDFFSQVWVDD